MYFIILQANLELFKLLKSKEFSTPYPPPLGGLRANPPHPTPPPKIGGGGGGGGGGQILRSVFMTGKL